MTSSRKPIRVLVADNVATTRALLVQLLATDPDLVVVAVARDGREALEAAERLAPDVIVMDVGMPNMDGFEATRRIMNRAPAPVVIITASMAPGAMHVTMEALACGALTALPTPPGPFSPRFEEEGRRFVRTVKAMSEVKVVRRWSRVEGSGSRPPGITAPELSRAAAPRAGGIPRVSAIGLAASTGGPAALARVLERLPADLPVPLLVVQHISMGFTEGFARWLGGGTALRVKVAEEREVAVPGTVYIAPSDRHLTVLQSGHTALLTSAPVEGFRPSATALFGSMAAAFGAGMVAVVLTGMGSDGAAALPAVRRAGGYIVAQDEASSVIFGMPRAAIAEGLVDAVVPLSTMSDKLRELTGWPS
jgi:two-component system, chemotaxis family, protein-glutamate methylesterase/glutaminase